MFIFEYLAFSPS